MTETAPPSGLAGGIIPFAFPGLPSVGCAFTTALAGTMLIGAMPDAANAAANRRRTFEGLGLARWVELQQVHGDILLRNPAPTPLAEPSSLEGDGACTDEKGLALAIKTADCQPILLADKEGGAVAALHVGWRGNAMNFPASGLRRFCTAYSLPPSRVLAVRGPSLGPSASEFINFAKEWPPAFRPWFTDETRTMDLWRLTRHQLIEAGLLPEHCFSLDLCTHSLPGHFFSHRRGHSGRQVSLIWIKE